MTQTTEPKRVILRPGRERPILQRHPWVLSGSVARVEGDPQAGDDVQLIGAQGEPLGYGDYDPASQLRVRVHHFGAAEPPPEANWLRSRIGQHP